MIVTTDEVNVAAAEITSIVSGISRTPDHLQDRRLWDLRGKLADEFARRNGWRRTKRSFALQQLAERHNGWRKAWNWGVTYAGGSMMDHPYYFREPNSPYRPAAIACHNYCGPDIPMFPGIDALMVEDFPSWYWPGETRLVVLSPAA